jgi:hypothetical protein
MAWALSVPIPGNQKLVLIGCANHAHADGTESYPSLDTLATYACCDRSTARRNVRKLIEDGWLVEDGLGPKGQTKYRLNMGVQDATGGKLPRVANAANGGGKNGAEGVAAVPPEPSLEPSKEPSTTPAAREPVPEDFPEELRPHARTVIKVLRQCAARTPHAKAVSAMSLGNTMMARPYKPLVRAAFDYVAWHDGKQHKDLVAGYRNWLDRCEDLASTEPLTEDGRPVAGAGSSGRAPRPRPHDAEREERRRRDMEAAERVQRGEDS